MTAYRSLASHLQEDKSVKAVCERLLYITSKEPNSDEEVPFIFVGGSSGSGKSQMAFSIMSKLANQRRVHYFLFEVPRVTSQPIYKCFQNTSELFANCLNRDFDTQSRNPSSPSCSKLFRQQLYIYGFICELLVNEPGAENVQVTRKSGRNVLDLMASVNLNQLRPIFIIDECIAITDESLYKVRFVRNCFRSLGLGLVMMGTDSRAAKIALNIGDSSRNGESQPWCYIYAKFPPVHLRFLEPRPFEWLDAILTNSRPLFAQFAAIEAQKSSDLNAILKATFTKLVIVKKIFRNYYGKLGQLRLFQNAHYPLVDFNMQTTALIHSHFAELEGEKQLILHNDGCLEGALTPWKPASLFPKIEDDILLYMLLMGGKDYPAFCDENITPVPYGHFFLNCKTNDDYRSHILELCNSVQKSSDGMFLESLLCTTVCLASHTEGISGVRFGPFMHNLLFQLQAGKISKSQVSIGNLGDLTGMESYHIPFLSPPNQQWPDYIHRCPDSNFANLKRTKNADKIDILAGSLAGESKDYGNVIDLSTMKKILRRVPDDAKLELVFTRKLQKSYFNHPSKKFKEEFAETVALNRSYCKIDASKSQTKVEVIKGLPYDISAAHTVIFLEIDANLKSA